MSNDDLNFLIERAAKEAAKETAQRCAEIAENFYGFPDGDMGVRIARKIEQEFGL